MIIRTKHLGEIEIIKENIIYFPKGLPGFEDRKEFALIAIEDSKFYLLQDIKEEYISFLLVNPWDFYKDYSIEIKDEILKTIDVNLNNSDIMGIYSIVTLGENLETSSCNLLAPVIINFRDKKGRQIILNESPYKTKHKLFLEESGDANLK